MGREQEVAPDFFLVDRRAAPVTVSRLPGGRRWMRNGACVAKNTERDGLTASVLSVAAATAGVQHG